MCPKSVDISIVYGIYFWQLNKYLEKLVLKYFLLELYNGASFSANILFD
jgi:hypothetical protein